MTGRPSLKAVVAQVAVLAGPPPQPDRGAELAEHAITRAPEFDQRVTRAAQNWRFERVGIVERNLLRLALAELAQGVTPPRVVIDEAVKLAQWFAGPKAPAFVNGVLDSIARELGLL
ncbi:MAG TPA: transcription antitermination factor NusB [Gemmatimonadales bacterium]|nr:transcription antitermination factor NusB [Gemmatimonadales bacterium]